MKVYDEDLVHELTESEKAIIYNSVESHHGAAPHTSLESEIVTNADCYRFIHPLGVYTYIKTLCGRQPDASTRDIIVQAGIKLQEKWALITLPYVRDELSGHYTSFTNQFQNVVQDM